MSNAVRIIRCAILMSMVLLFANTAESQWGTIKGQVKVDGEIPEQPVFVKKGDTKARDADVCAAEDIPDESLLVDSQSNGLANVVIYLKRKPAKIHPDLVKSKNDEVIFNQKGCRYVPHVLVVRTDQKIRIKSDDAIAHHSHTNPLKGTPPGAVVSPRSPPEGYLITYLREPEPVPIKIVCDIHNWMTGYWVLLDHPYVAVTNSKGEFEIADLPVGEHEFQIWHERVGILDKSYKVTVKPADSKLEPIQVTAKKLLGLE